MSARENANLEGTSNADKAKSFAGEEETVTLQEVLRQQKELDDEYEQEYLEVLGGSDDKVCTYSQGYIKRQALYACLTCTPEARTDPTKRAGICLACSYNCHDGHDMVELYTKRNFRCDCGTAKILAVRCKLDSVKLDQNDRNVYNQNYSGVYCTCHRPYPDPDDSIEDEMIQCIICEDWFHSRHLQATVPKSNSFAEMICGDCMSQHDIISHYVGMSITKVDESDMDGTADVDDSMNTTAISTKTVDESKVGEDVDEINQSISDTVNQSIMNIIEINKSNTETSDIPTSSDEPPAKRQKIDTKPAKCSKPLRIGEKMSGATFWPDDWRKSICSCEKCFNELKVQKIEFLVDLEDTVLSYQEKGLAKVHETAEERAMRAFSQIDRQQQIDVLTGYNKLKDNLREFLHSYAEDAVTVTIDDVNRFFTSMREKEKEKQKNAK